MATPTIPNGEEYFFPIIYEGNGAGQRVGKFVPFTDNGTIDNSCLFQPVALRRLGRTPSSNGSGTKLTFSVWVKRTEFASAIREIFIANDYAAVGEALEFTASNQLNYYCIKTSPGSYDWNYVTNRTFEDTSKWYHIYVRRDTTDSTAADRVQIYVDGERVTSFATEQQSALNRTGWMNQTTYENSFGNTNNASYVRGVGYLAEMNMIDGSNPAVSTFGVTDTSTGRWVPKALTGITYGTNGFRCKFQDSSALGDDTSGNGNDLTATGMSTTNQTTDSPTQNHATLSPHSLYKSSNFTLSEGNLKATSTSTSGTHSGQGGMRIPNGGKYYWECEIDAGKDGMGIGIIPTDTPTTSANPSTATLYLSSGSMRTNGSNAISYGSGVSNGDIMGFALDLSNPANGKLYVSVNGTYENSGNPVTGANPAPANPLIGDFRVIYQDGSNGYAPVYIYNFGQKSFNTAPPTGFVALQQDNLPETAKGISGLVWTKNRDSTDNHQLYDSSRGKQLVLASNATSAEATVTDGLQKFLAGGQQIEDNVAINTSGESFVSWNWVANSGTTATNTDGSITSTVQVNTDAGFSIVQRTGTGSAGTVGHGLNKAPSWIFSKNLSTTESWPCWHQSITAAKVLFLNSSGATSTSPQYNTTAPTSSVFSVGATDGNNKSGSSHIDYVWCEVDGFSKFGSYIGNGSTNGPFIYTGFKPAWVMTKSVSTATNWNILDTTRSPINPITARFKANGSDAESTNRNFDFLSNGFKLRESGTDVNQSGITYIYMAFAEHPFVGDGTSPVTAR